MDKSQLTLNPEREHLTLKKLNIKRVD